jgi:hypothetical protein
MAKKMTYSELSVEMKNFAAATREHYGSHAFACGFLESSLANVLADLPAHKQMELVRAMQKTIEGLK